MSVELPLLVCGVSQGGHDAIAGVCHHCGLPVCAAHVVYLHDPLYARSKEGEPVSALHCARCARHYHRRLKPQREKTAAAAAARATGRR